MQLPPLSRFALAWFALAIPALSATADAEGPDGACCIQCAPGAFACVDGVTAVDCLAFGGNFAGAGTVCDAATCQPATECPPGCTTSQIGLALEPVFDVGVPDRPAVVGDVIHMGVGLFVPNINSCILVGGQLSVTRPYDPSINLPCNAPTPANAPGGAPIVFPVAGFGPTTPRSPAIPQVIFGTAICFGALPIADCVISFDFPDIDGDGMQDDTYTVSRSDVVNGVLIFRADYGETVFRPQQENGFALTNPPTMSASATTARPTVYAEVRIEKPLIDPICAGIPTQVTFTYQVSAGVGGAQLGLGNPADPGDGFMVSDTLCTTATYVSGDTNGNGYLDPPEPFTEAIGANCNGVWDPGEFFTDFDGDGIQDATGEVWTFQCTATVDGSTPNMATVTAPTNFPGLQTIMVTDSTPMQDIPTVPCACCLPDGCVENVPEDDCAADDGRFFFGQACVELPPDACPTACCLPTGLCVEGLSMTECIDVEGGRFFFNMTCADVDAAGLCNDACCLPDGSCVETLDQVMCLAQNGRFFFNMTCKEVDDAGSCPNACCLPDGSCADDIDQAMCVAQKGRYFFNMTCLEVEAAGLCVDACCLPDGSCVENLDQARCLAQRGRYFFNMSCKDVDAAGLCPDACCLPDGTCVETLDEMMCTMQGGLYFFNMTCAEVDAEGLCPDACCLPDGTCVENLNEVMCTMQDGLYFFGMTCAEVDARGLCPDACCLPDGTCVEDLDEVMCTMQDGLYFFGLTCAEIDAQGLCPGNACCLPDGTCVETLDETMCTMQDGLFFAGLTCAEIDVQGLCPDACCLPDGTCVEDLDEVMCTMQDGLYFFGLTCAEIDTQGLCPDACCIPDGTCVDNLDEAMCTLQDGIYFFGLTCAEIDAQGLCPEDCGDGNCFNDNGPDNPGCEDEECCQLVCAVDPFCCDVENGTWDILCVQEALKLCGMCGHPSAGDCFEANGNVGCDDFTCCQDVCGVDAFCCHVEWDEVCAGFAEQLCIPGGGEESNAGRSWFDPATWTDLSVPDRHVDIDLAGRVLVDRDRATARTLRVAADGHLVVGDGSLTVTTLVIARGGRIALMEASSLLLVESLVIEPGGHLDWHAGLIEIAGGVLEPARPDLLVGDRGPATLRFSGGASAHVERDTIIGVHAHTDAVVEVDGQGSTLATGRSLVIGASGPGRLSVTTNALVAADEVSIGPDGDLFGDATVSGDVVSSGRVRPGFDIGELRIVGAFAQDPLGSLVIELAGPGAHDALHVDGTADLSGTLVVALAEAFEPVAGDEFVIVTAGTRLGGFTTYDLPLLRDGMQFDIVYEPDAVRLKIVLPVP